MHQRQKKILDMLQKGKLLIPETADILGVSQMTLRRDLRELEKRKLLLQVKNGAIPHPARYEPEPVAEENQRLSISKKNHQTYQMYRTVSGNCGGALRALLQKISLRRRESRLAARASHSTVAVDFPETSPSVIPGGLRRPHNCG